jgi:hypothetical protein
VLDGHVGLSAPLHSSKVNGQRDRWSALILGTK